MGGAASARPFTFLRFMVFALKGSDIAAGYGALRGGEWSVCCIDRVLRGEVPLAGGKLEDKGVGARE